MTDPNIGVDISISHLDVFRLDDGAARRFDSSAAGFRAMSRWLGKPPVASPPWQAPRGRGVFEPTGAYHKAFEVALGDKYPWSRSTRCRHAGSPWHRTPGDTRAKSDAVDARKLARMGAVFNLEPQAACSTEIRVLRDLHVARAGLIKACTRLRNRAQTQDTSVLKRQTKTRLILVERPIAELDTEIATLIDAQESAARRCDILRSLSGVGAVTAATMPTLMPEIGTLDRKQVASLAGFAPITRPSGQWQDKAFIGSGRKPLRDALNMPALVALRGDPDLKTKYQRRALRDNPPKSPSSP